MPLAWLLNPRLLGGLALAAALAWAAWWWRDTGVQAERAHWQGLVAEAEKRAAKQEADAREASTQLAEAQREAVARVRTVTHTLVKEVPTYVTSNADRACIVPVGFVQHHDAAARLSALPAAPGGLVDAPSGVPLSRVESVVAGNYAAAHELAAEVATWRQWYARQQAIAGGSARKPAQVP